ncbi:MAG: TraB/GumN family protein [Rudaea sp.]|uniref:TraB/GumN family protein n=1 Tax=Rudaea sp. TaxID=2136325 RepID=UPI0039E651EB
MRAWFLIPLLLAAIVQSHAAMGDPPAAPPMLDTVLVTGEQPGPGLWKVTRRDSDHVLWILGTQAPLPKTIRWRSDDVEKIIASSQEVLADAQGEVKVGFFRAVFLLPAALGAKKNADGKTLKDILPPDLYARWLLLKQRWLGNDDGVERLRPILAANELYGKAIGKSGMTNKNALWPVIEKIAKRHRVPVREIDVPIPVDNARQAIVDFKSTAGQADIDCLATTMARLETDLDAMRARANAWAVGDLDKLKSLPYPDQRSVCLNALAANANLREKIDGAKNRIRSEWLAAAEAALWNNASTFAVMPISEMIDSDGRLAKLRAKGYVIDEPQ